MAKKINLCAVFFFAFFLSGCKTGTEGLWGILTGVISWSRQDWALSVSSFLDTAQKATESGNSTLRDYAVFGLASTYLAQDEYDSALARLSEIEKSSTPEILSGVWYQVGIIAFRQGKFDDAASFFRKSLESDPSSLDAKINLELSQLSLVERKSDRSSGSSAIREDSAQSSESDAIFNLVRKKEQDRWKNQEEESSRSAVADY